MQVGSKIAFSFLPVITFEYVKVKQRKSVIEFKHFHVMKQQQHLTDVYNKSNHNLYSREK